HPAPPTDPDRTAPSTTGLLAPPLEHLSRTLAELPEIVPRTCANRSHPDAEPQQFDTVVEGRRSYELGLAAGIPNAYAHLEHCVFSRALTASPDPGVRLVATDPVEKVRELKSRPGRKIWSVGGAQLAAALRPEIDELI